MAIDRVKQELDRLGVKYTSTFQRAFTPDEVMAEIKQKEKDIAEKNEAIAAFNHLNRLEKTNGEQTVKLAQAAKKVAEERINTEKRVESIVKGVQFKGSEVGAIDRVGRLLTALNTANSTYVASKKGGSPMEVLNTQLKTYIKDVGADISTAFSGREARSAPRKISKDIMTDLFGAKAGGWTTAGGIASDILFTDPTGVVTKGIGTLQKVISKAFPAIGQTASMISTQIGALATRLPGVEAGVGAVARQFNAFYDIGKFFKANPQAGYIGDYMKAFRQAAHTKDFSAFKQFGSTTAQVGWLPGTMKGMANTIVGGGAMPVTQAMHYPSEIISQLVRQFAPAQKPGMMMGIYDWVTNLYKAGVGSTPKFFTRNAQDNLIKSAMEPGIRPWDYLNAFKPYFGGTIGGYNKSALQNVGIISGQGSLGRTGLGNIPGYVNAFSENILGRLPVASANARAGKTLNQIAMRVEKVMYQYSDAYFTPLEKMMHRIFPFYKFEKGQMGFYPGALATNRKWSSLYYGKQGTMSDRDKNTPWLNPSYMDMYKFGDFGGTGTSFEDASRKLTLNPTAMFGSVNPTLQALFEGITNRKVFQNTSITGDTSGKAYQHLDRFTQAIVGFNQATGKTDNNIIKYILEKFLGPPLRTYQDVMNPDVTKAGVAFSLRSYPLTDDKRALMHQINQSQGGKTGWQSFTEAFASLFGNAPAGAAGPYPMLPGIPSSAKRKSDWVASMGGSTALMTPGQIDKMFAETPNTFGQADQTRVNEWRSVLALGRDMAKIFETETSDVGANWAKAFKKNIENLDTQGLLGGKGTAERAANFAALARQYDTTRPLKQGEYRFSQSDLAYKVIGNSKLEQAVKDEQMLQRNFLSKTAQLIRTASNKNSMDYIDKFVQAEMNSLEYQKRTSQTKGDDKFFEQRAEAITFLGKSMVEDLQYKVNAANADILKKWVEGMDEGVDKIRAMKDVEVAQFKASNDAKLLLGAGYTESYNEMIRAINARYDQQERVQRAKEAKEEAERLAIVYKSEMDNVLKATRSTYQRGGLSIEDFYGKEREALLARTTKTGAAIAESAKTELKPGDLEAMDQTIKALKTSGNMPQALQILEALDQMLLDAIVNGKGNIDKIQAIRIVLAKEAKEASAEIEDNKSKEAADVITLNKAISELSRAGATMTRDTFARKSKLSAGARFSVGGWSALAEPRPEIAAFEAKATEQRRSAGATLSGMAIDLKASGLGIEGMAEGADPEKYYSDIRDKVEEHYQNLYDLSSAGQNKILAMKKMIATQDAAITQTEADKEAFIYDTRIKVATDFSQRLLDLGTQLYEASNGKSREAFYLMKAMAIAQAIIKGKEAILNAFEAGTSIGGPYAIASGIAFAGVASAFVGAQIGTLLGQMFNPQANGGPGAQGKATGGKITQGRGGVDDVPVMAMKDEWFIKAPSAKKYGDKFMHALNEGVIDIGALNIPNLPSRSWQGTHFSEGGKVTDPSNAPVKVEIINKSGVAMDATPGDSFFNGQEYIVQIFLDAHNRNVGGLQERFPMRR